MQNKMIIQAEAAVDAKVPPADKAAYEKIVIAGMKVMFSKETHQQLIQGLKEAEDPMQTVADGVIGVLLLLFKQSQEKMPMTPMIFAGQSLLMEALDFMEGANMIEVTPDLLAQATQMYLEALLPKVYGPQALQEALGKTQAIMSDTQKMAEYKQSSGG